MRWQHVPVTCDIVQVTGTAPVEGAEGLGLGPGSFSVGHPIHQVSMDGQVGPTSPTVSW